MNKILPDAAGSGAKAPLPAAHPRTWGGRIIIRHLNYLAGNTVPLLFLFEQTHIYPDDDQGL